MMSSQLSVARLLWRAENVNGARINTAWTSDGVRSFTYRDLVSDVRDLAGALASIGVKRGSRIATMAWNTRNTEPGIGEYLIALTLVLFVFAMSI